MVELCAKVFTLQQSPGIFRSHACTADQHSGDLQFGVPRRTNAPPFVDPFDLMEQEEQQQ